MQQNFVYEVEGACIKNVSQKCNKLWSISWPIMVKDIRRTVFTQ